MLYSGIMSNVGLNHPPQNRRYCSSYNSILASYCLLITMGLCITTKTVAAETSAAPATAPSATPSAAPPAASPQRDLEPQVTITQHEDEIIEEYRINNQLYMIKVTPRKGYAYYLVDTDGDGRLDTRKNELAEDVLIPQWTILRWK